MHLEVSEFQIVLAMIAHIAHIPAGKQGKEEKETSKFEIPEGDENYRSRK